MRRVCFLVSVFLLSALSKTVVAESVHEIEQAFQGATIRSIAIDHPLALDEEELLSPTYLAEGQKLAIGALQRAVSRLYQKQLFRHVDLLAEQRAEGSVDLRFVLVPKLVLSRVRFEGNYKLARNELRRTSRLRKGELFNVTTLKVARERIIERYLGSGFPHAEVKARLQPERVPFVVVTFQVDEGEEDTIGDITLEGLPESLDSDIQSELQGAFGGERASERMLKKLRLRALSLLREEGYWEATIQDPVYERGRGKAPLGLEVSARAPLDVSFEGVTLFSRKELLAPLKLETRSVALSPYAVKRLTREIRSLYQSYGYLDVEVKLRQDDERKYRIQVEEGETYLVSEVNFEGHKEMSTEALRKVVHIAPTDVPVFSRMKYADRDVIEGDVARLVRFYQSKGYPEVEVEHSIERDEGTYTLQVLYRIEEGERRFFTDVEVVFEGERPKKFEGIELHAGSPIERDKVQSFANVLREGLLEEGYPHAEVRVEFDGFKLRYILSSGQKAFFGKTVIQGNYTIPEYLIRKQLAYSPGQLWRQSALEETEQALYALGFFQSVKAEALDRDPDSSEEKVSIAVVERETGSVEFGAAFHTQDGLELKGELGQRNLLGTGNALILGADVFFKQGARNRIFDAGIVRGVYRVPSIFGTTWDLESSLYVQYSVSLIDQYSFDRVGGESILSVPLRENLELRTGFRVYHEDIFEIVAPAIIGPNDQGGTFYPIFTFRTEYDSRDDIFDPRKGTRSVLGVDISTSEVSFLHILAHQTFYFPLNSYLIFAVNGELNLWEPFGDTEVIPISSREFLGGRNSLRGFQLNAVGPEAEDGTVIGGDRSVLMNLESQFLLTDSFVFLLFLDAGQAFLSNKGSFQGDSLDFSDISYSPGLGFRYRTPIGPLSLEYGLKSNRGGAIEDGNINIGLGATF